MIIHKKELFLKDLHKRFPLRFHMTVILLATALSGVLTSKILLLLHVNNLAIRYPLSVLFAYLVFFFCIKLWLWHIAPKRTHRDSNIADWLDLTTPPSSGGNSLPPVRGGGGNFGGGGVSGSFDTHSVLTTDSHISSVLEGGSSGVDSATDAVGEAAGAIGDECFILVALVALIATILGAAFYLVSEAPIILSEAAFEGLLATSLVKKARLIDDEDWIGSVFKTTWKPFVFTLVIVFITAVILHSHFPTATSLSEIIKTKI